MDINSLIIESNRLVLDIRRRLDYLSRSRDESAVAREEGEIASELKVLQDHCARLRLLLSKRTPRQREELKPRVDQIIREARDLDQARLGLLSAASAKIKHERERAELLSRRFTAIDDTSIMLGEAAHGEKLGNAHKGVDDLLGNASDILKNLGDQRARIKGIKRKTLDILQQLGLSNSVMRIIEQRTRQDKIFFWAGAAVTTAIMTLSYYYLA